jgi:hybrid cluster-associated redox disulfide protein
MAGHLSRGLNAMSQEQAINKNMTFGELLKKFPKAGPILANHGLHCIGCHVSVFETLEQGMKAHGMSDTQLDTLIGELNATAVS